jgi:hypothetical protein
MFIQDTGNSATIARSLLSGASSITNPNPAQSSYNFTQAGVPLRQDRVDRAYEVLSVGTRHKLFLRSTISQNAEPVIQGLLTGASDDVTYDDAGNARTPYVMQGPDPNVTFFNGISCDPRDWIQPVVGPDENSITRDLVFFGRKIKPPQNQPNFNPFILHYTLYNVVTDSHMVVSSILVRNTITDTIIYFKTPDFPFTSLPFVVPARFAAAIGVSTNPATDLILPNGVAFRLTEVDIQGYSVSFISNTGNSELIFNVEDRIAPANTDLHDYVIYKVCDNSSATMLEWRDYYANINAIRNAINAIAL